MRKRKHSTNIEASRPKINRQSPEWLGATYRLTHLDLGHNGLDAAACASLNQAGLSENNTVVGLHVASPAVPL